MGIKKPREVNQVANFALVEWNDNIAIADSPPADYVPAYSERMTQKEQADMTYWHALPEKWEDMHYNEFLDARRPLIAGIIRDGFTRLTEGEAAVEHPETLEDKVAAGEGISTEFKATLRVNLHTGQKDPVMEHAILKTIAGFLNSRKGGTLLVGVNDDGDPVGLDNDKFPNEDKMDLHLGNLVKAKLGASNMLHIHPRFDDLEDKRVLVVDCSPSKAPVYLKAGKTEEFYVRAGASSAMLPPSQMTDYIKQRFS